MPVEALIGTWDLDSLFLESANGEKLHLYGVDPAAILTNTPGGDMATVFMRRGRPKFENGIDAPAPDELEAAFMGFEAYCGTYTVDATRNMVTHHVEASRLPDWEGTDQVRYFELEGDTLRIRSAPIQRSDGDWVAYVVWTRRRTLTHSRAAS